jgi:hypothetical protein
MGAVQTNLQRQKRFDSEFVPQFEAAYDQWIKAGKNPFDFLTRKNIDEMMERIYPAKKRNMDLMHSQAGITGGDDKNAPPPPAPKDADTEGWNYLMARPPTLANNSPATAAQWGQVLTILSQNPTPAAMKWFDNYYGASGYRAEEVLQRLKGEKRGEQSAASNLPPQPTTQPGEMYAPF